MTKTTKQSGRPDGPDQGALQGPEAAVTPQAAWRASVRLRKGRTTTVGVLQVQQRPPPQNLRGGRESAVSQSCSRLGVRRGRGPRAPAQSSGRTSDKMPFWCQRTPHAGLLHSSPGSSCGWTGRFWKLLASQALH